MLQKINKTALKKLQTVKNGSLLSVYIPLEMGMKGRKFNKTQLHNVRSELKKILTHEHHTQIAIEIESILDKINQENNASSIAIFSDGVQINSFDLPFTPNKTTGISSTYDVGQLKDYYKKNKLYYVLAISKKGSKLFKGDMESLKFVPVAGLGQDIQTTLNIDEFDTNNLQNHPSAGGGNKGIGFHGHGGYKDIKKSLFDSYLRVVDKKVINFIKDKSIPLVLVSVNYEQSAYRHISKYPSIFLNGVSTSPDELSAADLHDKTFPLVSAAH